MHFGFEFKEVELRAKNTSMIYKQSLEKNIQIESSYIK